MLEEKVKRVVGYAWFQNSTPPTTEELRRYYVRYFSEPHRKKINFLDFIVDCGRPKSPSKRIGWNQVLEMKKQGLIDVVCIPSIRLLSEYPLDTMAMARELSYEPNPVETFFIYENLWSGHPDFQTRFSFHLVMEDYCRELRKQGRDMRKLFKAAQLPEVLP